MFQQLHPPTQRNVNSTNIQNNCTTKNNKKKKKTSALHASGQLVLQLNFKTIHMTPIPAFGTTKQPYQHIRQPQIQSYGPQDNRYQDNAKRLSPTHKYSNNTRNTISVTGITEIHHIAAVLRQEGNNNATIPVFTTEGLGQRQDK